MRHFSFLILALFAAMAACGPSAQLGADAISTPDQPQAEVQPNATGTPNPTRTPVPPTPTIVVPDPLASFFTGTRIDFYDPFDSNLGWGIGCGCAISNGAFVAIGKEWSGASWDERKLEEGHGLLMDFSFTSGSEFEVYIDVGDSGTDNYTDSYRKFGLYVFNNVLRANLWAGNQPFSGRLLGNLTLHPEQIYSLALMIAEGGEFGIVVWDPRDPSQFVSTHEKLGTSWADRSWRFAVGGNAGQIKYDNLRFVSFDGFVR